MKALVRAASLLAALVFAAGAADAQSYPARPVRFIVPFSAGAGTDIFSRLVAKKLGEALVAPQ